MKMIALFIVMALAALLVARIALALTKLPAIRQAWRKRHLTPLLFKRGGSPRFRFSNPGTAQFANIGEGDYKHGAKSFLPDAATTSRYLLYKAGSDADHVAVCGAGEDAIGSSDDQADAGIPLAVWLFGACEGTKRVITDGTISDRDFVKSAANGQVTKAGTGDAGICGRAVVPTDCSNAAGDVITIVPLATAKYSF